MHAYDEAREQSWADPVTGRSGAHWTRALGWLAMCLVDVAELLGPQRFAPLSAQTNALFERILELRRPGGLWLQVIDQPDLAGNFVESSGSAMLAYALRTAQSLGMVAVQDDICGAVLRQVMKPGPEGHLEMVDLCGVAGLGPYQSRYRDGSPGYYLTEPRVSNDAKGVGPLMMCCAVMSGRRVPAAHPLPVS